MIIPAQNNNLLIKLPEFSDTRGVLTVMQDVLPFEVKRAYWISAPEGALRGGHRHQTTVQALVAVSGEVEIFMNNGITKQLIKLSSQSECLLVYPQYWHTMRFLRSGSMLLVFSSTPYDVNEYIDTPYE